MADLVGCVITPAVHAFTKPIVFVFTDPVSDTVLGRCTAQAVWEAGKNAPGWSYKILAIACEAPFTMFKVFEERADGDYSAPSLLSVVRPA